jgi:hypothetical protein
MDHPGKDAPCRRRFLCTYVAFHRSYQRLVAGLIPLHQVAAALVDTDEMVVFVYDA